MTGGAADPMYSISSTTNLIGLARRLAREIRKRPVVVDGEFQRLRRLYVELVDRLDEPERARLAGLMVPLKPSHAEVRSRLRRRIGNGRGAASAVPLEHLLLLGDFAAASGIIDKLFSHQRKLRSGVTVDFNDPKGLISLGQYRAVLEVLDRLAPGSPAARLSYVVERHHDHVTFHQPVQLHRGADRATIDVAQLEQRDDFASALARELESSVADAEPVWLDPAFVRYDQTCVWDFNRAFWRFLSVWESVTGKSYQRALPKGKAESNHQEFIDEAAARLASHIRELEREGALNSGDELWISEKAPGSGGFIAGLLDYLRERHSDSYRRLRVVLSDISADVLTLTANELKKRGHLPCPAGGPRIFFWHLGGGRAPDIEGGERIESPPEGGFLYLRHANFFDQLPTRLFARTGGRYYELHVRAAVDPERLKALEQRYGITLAELRAVIEETVDLTTLDSDRQARFIHFWSEVWETVKLREHYQPLERLAGAHPDGAEIERLFASLDDVRFVTSDVALETLRSDLRMLHPEHGYACFTDIYLQRAAEFKERWIELAKYDNGVWVGTNGVLMNHLIGLEGCDSTYYPVELTLGVPTAVYTMSLSRRHPVEFTVMPELVQELTGIAAAELAATVLADLPRRVRNNLRDLPELLAGVEPDLDWGRRTFDQSLDLTRLMRELYYHSPPSAGTGSLFLKMAALIGEVLDRYRDRRVRIEADLTDKDLRALEDFLDPRPITDLPKELVAIGPADGETLDLRLRLPTLGHKLRHGEFLILAEVDLPRAQSLEQLRRRILQFQAHVDAVSLTSGRMADPRFLRSREALSRPLFKLVHPDRLVITLEMCDRQAADLERDIDAAETQGVRNLFIVTGDFERDSDWWLDSLHGIQIADRMRNGEGADGRALERRSRTMIAGALTWGGIPDFESRLDRDVEAKVRAGADLLFTQPVYDLRRACRMLDEIVARGLDREVHILAEVLPLLTLDVVRNLSQTPGIAIPAEMAAAYERIDKNVADFCKAAEQAELTPEQEGELFSQRVFAGVGEIPGYQGFFSAARARALYRPVSRAIGEARSKAPGGREFEEGRQAARRATLTEVGFGLAEQVMAALAGHQAISGFLFVPRTGRDLRRLTTAVARLRQASQAARETKRTPARFGAELGRRYGSELVRIADRLAPYGLFLPDGTPTNLRVPALIRAQPGDGPVVLTRLELDGAADRPAALPLGFETLADALGRVGNLGGLDFRVLCVPTGWEQNSQLIQMNAQRADLEVLMKLRGTDAQAGKPPRRLRVRTYGEPFRARAARFLERHPVPYSLAVLTEFWIKHPLFGQVLCGGPCGISSAWQFTCTMSKTFTSKRRIERNLLDRPIFVAARQRAARSAVRRLSWSAWEAFVRAMLWPPIALRRGIVAIAASFPARWFLNPGATASALATRVFNHLECPKSLRNGACGAPSAQGLCGELLKYGVSKPCVFCYRNARDRRGQARAAELGQRALRWRELRPRWIGEAAAAAFEMMAAFADRRPLSRLLYPRVDPTVPGSSAIVSAMGRRFGGAKIFGNPQLLPPSVAHSEIMLEARNAVSRRMLPEVRRRLKPVAPTFENRSLVVATMLAALSSAAARMRPAPGDRAHEETTYERMFMGQIGASHRPGRHP